MKYTVHGMSLLGWMMEFESESEDKLTVWNEAASASSEAESRVMEQTNRVLATHPADMRCAMCPAETGARKPKPPAPPADASDRKK